MFVNITFKNHIANAVTIFMPSDFSRSERVKGTNGGFEIHEDLPRLK